MQNSKTCVNDTNKSFTAKPPLLQKDVYATDKKPRQSLGFSSFFDNGA